MNKKIVSWQEPVDLLRYVPVTPDNQEGLSPHDVFKDYTRLDGFETPKYDGALEGDSLLLDPEEKADAPAKEDKENPGRKGQLRRLRKCLSFDEVDTADGELSGAAEALSKEKESVEKFLNEHVAMACEDSLSAEREADRLIAKLLEKPGCHEEPGEELAENITPTVAEMTPDKAPLSPTWSLSPEAQFKPPRANRPVQAPKPRSTAAKSAPKSKPTSKENRDPNKGKDDNKKKAPTKTEKKLDGKNLPADELDPTNTSEKPAAKVPGRKRGRVPTETVEKTPSGSSVTKKGKRAKKDADKGAEDDKDKDTNSDKKDTAVPEMEEEKPKEMGEEMKDEDVKVYADGWTDLLLKKKLHSVYSSASKLYKGHKNQAELSRAARVKWAKEFGPRESPVIAPYLDQ